jgi:glutathione synthase/RimK-type ligase-like ATP-grasp enzyme
MPETSVLLVRHGPGRGRLQRFGNGWLKRLAATRPRLRSRIQVHETGSGAAPSLHAVVAVVFLLADPLRELYPACYAVAVEIAARAALSGIRCVNPPDALSNTIKTVQARLWQEAGVPSAPNVSFRSREELHRIALSATFPAIVRPDLLHAQQRVFVCHSAEDLRALPEEGLAYPGLVVRFVDSRATHRADAPDTVFARYYHRCRTYVFGRHVVPGAIYFSEDPIVGTETATWARYQDKGRFLEPFAGLRAADRRTIAADVRFASSPPRQPELMRQAAGVLGLEFAGLDHILLADGSAFFWEANPHPYIANLRHTPLPLLRRIVFRTRRISDAIGDFLADAPPEFVPEAGIAPVLDPFIEPALHIATHPRR